MEDTWTRVSQPEIVKNIDRFHPSRIHPDSWSSIEILVKQAITKAEPYSTKRSQELLTVATRIANWAWEVGRPTTTQYLFDPSTIDEYINRYCGELSEGTRSNYRTQLRQIGAANLGAPLYGPKPQPLWKRTPKAPYTSRELSQILGSIKGYSTERQRSGLTCLIGLAYGAGLERSEIARVLGSDVEQRNGGLIVKVKGSSARTAVLSAKWAEAIATLADQAKNDSLFLPGRGLSTASQLKGFIDRLPERRTPKVSLARLRNTWLIELLQDGIRIDVVAKAAGINADQVGYYAQFIESVDDDTYIKWLGR